MGHFFAHSFVILVALISASASFAEVNEAIAQRVTVGPIREWFAPDNLVQFDHDRLALAQGKSVSIVDLANRSHIGDIAVDGDVRYIEGDDNSPLLIFTSAGTVFVVKNDQIQVALPLNGSVYSAPYWDRMRNQLWVVTGDDHAQAWIHLIHISAERDQTHEIARVKAEGCNAYRTSAPFVLKSGEILLSCQSGDTSSVQNFYSTDLQLMRQTERRGLGSPKEIAELEDGTLVVTFFSGRNLEPIFFDSKGNSLHRENWVETAWSITPISGNRVVATGKNESLAAEVHLLNARGEVLNSATLIGNRPPRLGATVSKAVVAPDGRIWVSVGQVLFALNEKLEVIQRFRFRDDDDLTAPVFLGRTLIFGLNHFEKDQESQILFFDPPTEK